MKFKVLPALLLAGLLSLTGCGTPDPTPAQAAGAAAGPAAATGPAVRINTSPEQNRIRADGDPDAAALLPQKNRDRARLVVATTAGSAPLSFHASDDKTVIGSELDLAQLVADKLGLALEIQVTSWESWPLKTQSGDYDAVFSNVGINDERRKIFDFASYRAAYMGFVAAAGSTRRLESADDIAGLKIAVGPGTNQEKILLAWNETLLKAGRAPAELVNFGSASDTLLSLQSGRIDAALQPYPTAVYQQATASGVKVVGKVNAGWPKETLVAATTAKGNGLAEALSAAINSAIRDGSYGKVLDRWGLAEEALPESTVVS